MDTSTNEKRQTIPPKDLGEGVENVGESGACVCRLMWLSIVLL